MTRYLFRQTALSLLKLFIFVTFMFFFIQALMPGDWVDQFSIFLSALDREELREQLGLNLPIWQRYIQWVKQVFSLELGYSLTGEPIVDILKRVVPPTLLVFLTGTIIAYLFGLWLGKQTAWRGPSFTSRLTTLGGITLFTSFPPWLAWLVAYIFAGGVGYRVMGEIGGLHAAHFEGLTSEIWRGIELTPSEITFHMVLTIIGAVFVILILESLVERITRRQIPFIVTFLFIIVTIVGSWYFLEIDALTFDILKLSWLAVVTYTLLSFGETMLIMQSSMTEVLKEEYITTAFAKGLPKNVIREKHAARNAILPVLSRLMISLPYLITGIVIIESSVAWPGMGTTMWNALYWQNMPLVMNTLLIVGVLSLFARLFLDVLIAFLDPRIRYGETKLIAS